MRYKKLVVQSIMWRGLYFLTAFVLNILLTRYFFATGSGWVYYISNNFAFFILIAGLCLESGTSFYGSKNEVEYHKLSLLSMCWAIIVSVVLLVIINIYYRSIHDTAALRFYSFFSVTYASGILLTTYYSTLFYSRQDFATPNRILVATNLVLILFFPLAEFFNKRSLITNHYLDYYFAAFLVQGVLIASAFAWKNNAGRSLVLPRRTDLKKILRYALYSLLANVLFFLMYRMDYWFIKKTCTVCHEGDLGNYIQASKLVQLFLVLPAILSSTVFPRTAAGFRQEMNTSIQVLSRIVFLAYAIALAVLAITGRWLFPFIFGSTFNHMYRPFLFLMPGVLSLSVLSFIAAYNAGKGRISTNLKGTVIALLIIAVGDYMFIPRYGIEAAAVISSAGYACYLLYVLVIFKREYRVSMIDFFVLKQKDWYQLKRMFK